MTTGKTIALTGQNFVGKVMSLLFNMLSRLVITQRYKQKSKFRRWRENLRHKDNTTRATKYLPKPSPLKDRHRTASIAGQTGPKDGTH